MAIALETIGLLKQFGGLTATATCRSGRGWRAPRADRAERCRQDHADQSAQRCTEADLRPHSARGRGHHRLSQHARVGRGMVRTFQINQLFGRPDALETIGLAVSERNGHGMDVWRPAGSKPALNEEIASVLEASISPTVMNERTAILPYGKQRLLEIAVAIACRPRVLLLDEPAAGGAGRRAPRNPRQHRRAAERTSPCC